MSGLAAALNAPDAIHAMAWALAARGAESAECRLNGVGGADLVVAVRAALPTIPRRVAIEDDFGWDDGEEREPTPVVAFAVDGIAVITRLDRGYAAHGATGLIDDGAQPYAVVLADADRDELVLARNGNGPGLYYARLGEGWVAASEPGALLRAGVPTDTDPEVVREFIETGACDDSERTFFAWVRRVLPGEVIILRHGIRDAIRHSPQWTPRVLTTEGALRNATEGPRVGLLLAPGLAGAAVLGAALNRAKPLGPLPVHTAALDYVKGDGEDSPPVLTPLPDGTVRHVSHTVGSNRYDLDRFLADIGEPVPDLGYFVTWAVARDLDGDVDTLVDASPGTSAGAARVADRLLARYGVAVQWPLRQAVSTADTLVALAGRSLPADALQQAATDANRLPSAAQIVQALGDEVAAALVTPRPWSDPVDGVTALRQLHAGEPADGDAVLRAFLVERWLAGMWPPPLTTPAPVDPHSTVDDDEPVTEIILDDTLVEPDPPPVGPPSPGLRADEVTVGGENWLRVLVPTAPVAPGDQVGASLGWYAANALADLWPDPLFAEALAGPWFLVLSGKAVAVSQQRVTPLESVIPGRAARALSPLARRRLPQLAQPWSMQVAIDHSGLFRIATTVLLRRPLRLEHDLYPPRPGAMPPADAAVVRVPYRPDQVAAGLVTAIRHALPGELSATLAGCAIVSADELGCRVLGYADGPNVGATVGPRTLLSLILSDNPAGQDAQRTPVAIVARAPFATPTRRRDYARLDDNRAPAPR